ncbi:MAG: MGMT family protein [Thiolinea sp.]
MNFVHPPNKQDYYTQVWELVQQIPYGKVATYGQIAQLIPCPEGIEAQEYQASASRWVGTALAACPKDIPWQRVINSQGRISQRPDGGYQRERLLAEGVVFIKERISLPEYQWHGPGQASHPVQGSLF